MLSIWGNAAFIAGLVWGSYCAFSFIPSAYCGCLSCSVFHFYPFCHLWSNCPSGGDNPGGICRACAPRGGAFLPPLILGWLRVSLLSTTLGLCNHSDFDAHLQTVFVFSSLPTFSAIAAISYNAPI